MLDHTPLFLAYIDPGTGSMILQAVIATLLGAGVFFRRVMFNPMTWLKNRSASEE
jgi:hypothetical protein